jgi:hypothetical protein
VILVRVLRHFGAWNAGETAGFPAERAQQLIEAGVAELVAPEAQAERDDAAEAAPAEQPAVEPARRRRG